MVKVVLLCLICSFAFGANEEIVITTDLTAKNEAPEWIKAFAQEVEKYELDTKQFSLKVLRATGRGNCVALAKLAASYALAAGEKCRLICIASGEDSHVFLYTTYDNNHWAVSNKTYRQVVSLEDALFQMNALGSVLVSESRITIKDLGRRNPKNVEVDEPIKSTFDQEGRTVIEYPSKFITVGKDSEEYNFNH